MEKIKAKSSTRASFLFRGLTSGKFVADAVDFVFKRAIARHLTLDYVNRGKDGRVIASENFCRVLQGEVGYVTDDVNGDVARECDLRGTLFALDVFDADVIALGDVFDDLFRNERGRNRAGDDA